MNNQLDLPTGPRLVLDHLYGGELTSRPREVLGPRKIIHFELLHIIDGSATYHSGGQTFHVPPGGFVLGQPGVDETYVWDPRSPTRHAYFHFVVAAYPADWPAPADWPRTRNKLGSLSLSLFKQILRHIYQHEDWPAAAPGVSDCRLVELLLDMFLKDDYSQRLARHPNHPEPVRQALELMRQILVEDPQRPLSLQTVAQAAHVTEKHLCRLFSETLGQPPMKTYSLLKLQAARPLLTRTSLSIKEISERCGFENPLYFSRCFSKTFGCPPTEFRNHPEQALPLSIHTPLSVDLIPRTRK